MNWKAYGRKQSCHIQGTIPSFAGETEENDENPQSGSWPRFKLRTYRI